LLRAFVFLFVFKIALFANGAFAPFIQQQLQYIYALNENNITQEKINTILQKQKESYTQELNFLMSHKRDFIENTPVYDQEIYALKKILQINKKAGYKYAVLRDEVKLKSYKLLANQNIMIRNILISLDYTTKENFSNELTKYVVQNQQENEKLLKEDYTKYLSLKIPSKIFKDAQKNIREFYALVELNQDIVSNLYLMEKKIYALNKYSKYHLIGFVVKLNSYDIVKFADRYLNEFGLSVVKIVVAFFFVVFVYFFRKVFYIFVTSLSEKFTLTQHYSSKIIEVATVPFNSVFIAISLNGIVYIFNDFATPELLRNLFNIVYAFLVTLTLYRILNTIAELKIAEIDNKQKKIKSEVINIGIKVINSLVWIIGFLVVLYFAGVDLTAVLSGLGIGGFAVALAAKDSLANFFGTLSILLSDIFSQGDWIVVDGNEGIVIEIGLRVTTIRTFDNAFIAIPNAVLATKDVKNWNKRILGRRIKFYVGLKYDSKPDNILKAIDEIRTMLEKHTSIASKNTRYDYKKKSAKLVAKDDLFGIKKTLMVYLDNFGDSSLNILVYCFTKTTDWEEYLAVKEDVMIQIMNILEKHHLEIAFPSLSLYHENQPKELL